MKSEIKPGVIAAVVIALVVVIAGVYAFAGGGLGGPEKIDIKKLDPKELRDENPPRRGDPNYRERTGR